MAKQKKQTLVGIQFFLELEELRQQAINTDGEDYLSLFFSDLNEKCYNEMLCQMVIKKLEREHKFVGLKKDLKIYVDAERRFLAEGAEPQKFFAMDVIDGETYAEESTLSPEDEEIISKENDNEDEPTINN